jgi:molybdenum cofactor biosynthesis enzyme MoaA
MTSGPAPGAGIRLTALRELWVHTGTACNLSCPFCHEGSQPGDTRLAAPGFEALRPLLDAAAAAGASRFAFTGGEPLIHKDIVRILRHALALRPVLVLTNGTAPLIRRPHHLAQLRDLAHSLSFRVSIDYPDETRHDAGRGFRNFRKALQGLKLLVDAGFTVGITRLSTPDEDAAAITSRFRQLLRKQQLPDSLQIVALPELGRPDASLSDAVALQATTPGPEARAPACTLSRMLIRRGDALTFSPCPFVDDRPELDLGPSLDAAMTALVTPRHARCATCLGVGIDYAGEL